MTLDASGDNHFRFSEYWEAPLVDETLSPPADSAAMQPFCRQGWRAVIRAAKGDGTIDRVRFAPGVEVSVLNCMLPKLDTQIYEFDESVIMLYASLASDMCFSVEGHEPLMLNQPELTMIYVPRGTRMKVTVSAGVRQQRLFGVFRRAALANALGIDEAASPKALREAAAGRADFGRLVSMPLDPRMSQLLADTIDTNLQGEMRALQYQARLLEFAAYALDGMEKPQDQDGAQLHTLREVKLARQARERLDQEYHRPPDLKKLAYELGSNPNKLRSAFKAAFGLTMVDYCRDRRMREAQQLLLQPRLSIAQVAEMVGYEYPSGFAAAFSAHVGMTPRDYRRHRAPVSVSA